MISNSNKDIYGRCGLFLFLALATTTLRPQPALAQTGPTSWAGQITCQLDDQDATYSRHEIQTWKLIGGPPDPQPGIPHYPAIWSASGQGALQRVRGNETVNMQWTTSVPSANAMIAIFVRASDQKLIIKTWHGQLTVPNAVNGTKQVTQNGVTEPPSSFSHAAWEWSFPHIEVDASGSVVTGSTTSQADAGSAELVHHFGGVPPNTTCQWQLASGGAAVPVATPPVQGTVTALPQQPVTGIALPSSGTPPVQGTVTALPQQPVTGIALPSSGTPPVQGTVTALPQHPAIGIALPSSGTPTVQGTVTALPQQPAIGIALPSSGTPTGTVTALPGLQNTVKSASLTPQLVQVTPPATQQTAGGPGPTVSVKLLGQNTGFQNGVSTVTFTASTSSPTAAQQQAVMTALHKASESYTQLLQSTQLALTSPPTRPSTLQVSSFQVSSATSAVAQVVIDPAAYGPYDVAVTTPLPNGKGPEVASMTAGFTVAPASTVPAASGNYLITMTGLLCMSPTVDDQLNRDGKGDEIYGAAFVRQYNRTTGQLTNSRNAKTWVYGDTNGFVDAQGNPTRKQAGSLSPLGASTKTILFPISPPRNPPSILCRFTRTCFQ